jgi:hypothetical protein
MAAADLPLASTASTSTHIKKALGLVMKDIAAKAANNTTQKGNGAPESIALARRYGQIGISAVAAAARYQGGARNPAYAPAPIRWVEPADETT